MYARGSSVPPPQFVVPYQPQYSQTMHLVRLNLCSKKVNEIAQAIRMIATTLPESYLDDNLFLETLETNEFSGLMREMILRSRDFLSVLYPAHNQLVTVNLQTHMELVKVHFESLSDLLQINKEAQKLREKEIKERLEERNHITIEADKSKNLNQDEFYKLKSENAELKDEIEMLKENAREPGIDDELDSLKSENLVLKEALEEVPVMNRTLLEKLAENEALKSEIRVEKARMDEIQEDLTEKGRNLQALEAKMHEAEHKKKVKEFEQFEKVAYYNTRCKPGFALSGELPGREFGVLNGNVISYQANDEMDDEDMERLVEVRNIVKMLTGREDSFEEFDSEDSDSDDSDSEGYDSDDTGIESWQDEMEDVSDYDDCDEMEEPSPKRMRFSSPRFEHNSTLPFSETTMESFSTMLYETKCS